MELDYGLAEEFALTLDKWLYQSLRELIPQAISQLLVGVTLKFCRNQVLPNTLQFHCPSTAKVIQLWEKSEVLALALYQLRSSLGQVQLPHFVFYCVGQVVSPLVNPMTLLVKSSPIDDGLQFINWKRQQSEMRLNMSSQDLQQPTSGKIIDYLRNVDTRRLLEFELEMVEQGLIVSFTSQRTNICIKSGDLAYKVPSRSIWQPYKYRGFNYLIAWDTDFSGKPNNAFFLMQDFLQLDGFVSNFTYRLRRPGDNALVEYQSSFYLFPDPAGEPGGIRACVSRQQDFLVIEEGNLILAGR